MVTSVWNTDIRKLIDRINLLSDLKQMQDDTGNQCRGFLLKMEGANSASYFLFAYAGQIDFKFSLVTGWVANPSDSNKPVLAWQEIVLIEN